MNDTGNPSLPTGESSSRIVPRWVVNTSFAVSLVGFMGASTAYFHLKGHSTMLEGLFLGLQSLIFPVLMIPAGLAGGHFAFPLIGFVLIVPLVVSVWNRRRPGGLVTAHICLLVYYWMSVFMVKSLLHAMAC